MANVPITGNDGIDDWKSLADLLDASGVYLWQSDANNCLVYKSPGLQTLLSASCLSDENGKAAFLTNGTSQQSFDNLVVICPRLSGGNITCLFSAEAEKTESGNFAGYRGTCRLAAGQSADTPDRTDVTTLKTNEQVARDTESRFLVTFHSSPLMMFMLRLRDWTFIEVNNKFTHLTGYHRDELLNAELGDSLVFADEDTQKKIRSRLKRGLEVDELEVVLRRKDGELIEVLVSAELIEEGGEQRILGIGVDFTTHKRLENSLINAKDAAEFANRSKSEFLANMSHELRTPLNAVIGFSEFLANEAFGPLGDPRYVEYVSDIRDSGMHLLNLINDILDVSKVEAGKMELREREVSIDDIMARCIRSVAERALSEGVKIIGGVTPDLPMLLCDETKLRQILTNVLNNAVKFTDQGGEIEIGGDVLESGDLEIRIKDTGIGIAPEDMENVFRLFGQAEVPIDRHFEGAGLGLPLTKALVELHDGEFHLESELGVGTTVYIIFPNARLIFPEQAGEPDH